MNSGVIPRSELEGWDRPLSLEHLNQYVKPSLDSKWYDLGVELLEDDDDIAALNKIQCDYHTDIDTCCTKMFDLWLEKRQHMASWSHLVESLRQPNVNLSDLANRIELMAPQLGDATCQNDRLVTVASINEDFRNLLVAISTILDDSPNKESDLEKCKNYCCSLRTSDNSDQPLFSVEDISLIHRCTGFNQLLRILNWHLSWDEHSILSHIVAKCQSVRAQEEIENFDKKTAEKLEIISSSTECDLPSGFRKLCIVINKPFKSLTKSKYEEIKEFVFRQLDTRHYVATSYVKVFFHSLHLEWYVTHQAIPFMVNMAFQNKDVFVKEGFVFMQIGEETIFDNQGLTVPPSLNKDGHEPKRKRSSVIQRTKTQANIPNNAISKRLKKLVKYQRKSCLQFFNSIEEQSDEDSSHDSSRSPSPLLKDIKAAFSTYNVIHDKIHHDDPNEIHEDTQSDVPERQSTDRNGFDTSIHSSLDKRFYFSDYVASSQDSIPTSELIMKAFDNDDIEGIIPPRFLEAEPDALLDNIRKEERFSLSSSAVSSSRSSLDGESSIPSYNVPFVRSLRRSLRVSTATVTRMSWCSDQSESFSLDIPESLRGRLSAQDSMASGIDEVSCTSLVNDADSNEPSSVISQTNRRHRKLGMVRSRESVLQWLADRHFPSVEHRDSLYSLPERKNSVSGSEASDVESYHSVSDDHDVVSE